MYLIVGLGNPEPEYSNTRHNMGFNTINLLANEYKIELNKSKFKGIYGIGEIENQKVIQPYFEIAFCVVDFNSTTSV